MNLPKFGNIVKGLRRYYPVSDSSIEELYNYLASTDTSKKEALLTELLGRIGKNSVALGNPCKAIRENKPTV